MVHEVQRSGRPLGPLHRPTTVIDALRALRDLPGARPIAGGTDLLLDLHRGGPGPAVPLVDLTALRDFGTIEDTGGVWRLGGGVTHNQVVAHRGIRATALPLAQACLEIGSPQLRNRATVAGNLVTASPANDSISALMALGATVVTARLAGDGIVERRIVVSDLFDGFRSTVLAPDELIVAIEVPALGTDARGIWVKLGLRRAQAISVVHAGVVVEVVDGVVESASVALGSVAPTVVLVPDVADALTGRALDARSIAAAADAAAAAVTPIDDVRATADYRSGGVVTMVRRALEALADDAQADMWPHDPPTLSDPDELARPSAAPRSLVDDQVRIRVNGHELAAPAAGRSLLDWVRHAGAGTGSKEGCAEGECGACTMILDGAAVMSCLVAAGQADGGDVTTVEGIDNPALDAAFVDEFAVQCGFCIPGFVVAGARLLDEVDEPDDDQIELALSGNLCRCTGYYPIATAVRTAGGTR